MLTAKYICFKKYASQTVVNNNRLETLVSIQLKIIFTRKAENTTKYFL